MSVVVAIVAVAAIVVGFIWLVWAILTARRDYALVVRPDAPIDPVLSHANPRRLP